MYISEIIIDNYRNFEHIEIPLNKFTILIGENDIGKSNVIEAIRLVLNNNTFQYSTKTLGITDINSNRLKKFKEDVKLQKAKISQAIQDKNLEYLNTIIPVVKIKLKITEANTEYQKALLSDWLNEDNEGNDCYEVEYVFKPKDEIKFMQEVIAIQSLGENYILPLNMYEYKIISSNNGKGVRFDKFQNFNISYIGAERDNFSETDKQMSYKLVSSLLEKNLSKQDRYLANQAYIKFFDELKDLDSYKDVFNKFNKSDFDNWREIIDKLELGPNTPNLKSIFSNINMTYGEKFLYQKGLGTRNLLLIILLFTNYLNEERKFNLISIEEPEAHMCVNNLNLAIDFITKSLENIETEDFVQGIITTHNYNIINKLKFENVVLLKDNQPISFSQYSDMSKYLAKRPNFDILKILLSKRVILVEGPTEEMYINTYLQQENKNLNMAEVIVTGKGYTKFLDIWKVINQDTDKKIGVVRDYDNQPKAKKKHDEYDDGKNIFVRTTKETEYTFEDALINQGNNRQVLEDLFQEELKDTKLEDYMTDNKNKTENMFKICNSILDNKIKIEIPTYIKEIIDGVCSK